MLEAINRGEPIHTSTGIFLNVEDSGVSEYGYIAKDMYFDHDAILLGEEGAATPSQGVGMMVNKTASSFMPSLTENKLTRLIPCSTATTILSSGRQKFIRRYSGARQSRQGKKLC